MQIWPRMRYPIIRQHDSTDCGPTVLAMIAAYHGERISTARLRELAGGDRQGATLAGLCAAAAHVGFKSRAVRSTLEALQEIPLPAVAHWREDDRHHYVALYEVSVNRIVVGDPASGLQKLTSDEFLKKWTGVLLLLTPDGRCPDAVESKSSFSRLYSLLLQHSHLFLDALLAAVLMTILALTSSFFIQALVDFVFVLGRKPALNSLGLGMLLVTLARAGFLGLRSYLLAHLCHRIEAETVTGYHRHLLGLPLSFFSSRCTGEILSRINDAARTRIAISAKALSLVADSILVVTAAGVMALLNWRLALRSLQFVPAFAGVIWLLNGRMKRHRRAAMEKAAAIGSQMLETIGAIHDIKALRAERRAQLVAEARFAEMIDASLKAQVVAAYSAATSSLMMGLST